MFCASVIGIQVFWIAFDIIFHYEFTIFVLIRLGVLIFLGVECVFFLKSFFKEEIGTAKKSIDVIGVFTRPETITEEEVSVSKEKKVCLVCKGKILKFNYVCPECESFYCEKCYNALINLENAYWACKTALDESKPVKIDKDKEQEVDIELSEKKSDKPKNR